MLACAISRTLRQCKWEISMSPWDKLDYKSRKEHWICCIILKASVQVLYVVSSLDILIMYVYDDGSLLKVWDIVS